MKNKVLNLFLLATLIVAFISCSNNDSPQPSDDYSDYSCIIVNQGNYSEKNGSISYYRERDNTIVNGAFKRANGRNLAALVESATIGNNVALLMCNAPDKIEIIDVRTAKVLSAPIQGSDVVNPRYAVINGNYAYVTCWNLPKEGDWNEEWQAYEYIYPDSYILKIDLTTKSILKKIDCGDECEGITVINNKLFVAVSGGVDVFSTETDAKVSTIKYKTFTGKSKHLAIDNTNKLWVSVVENGFIVVDLANLTVNDEVDFPTVGYFCMNKAKDKVVSLSEVGYKSKSIYTIDVSNRKVSEKPIFEGDDFYGVGVNPQTDVLYTAEIYGFTANSTLKIFNSKGSLLNQTSAGMAASRFMFF